MIDAMNKYNETTEEYIKRKKQLEIEKRLFLIKKSDDSFKESDARIGGIDMGYLEVQAVGACFPVRLITRVR